MSERSSLLPAGELTGGRQVGPLGVFRPIFVVAATVVFLGGAGSALGQSVIKVGVYDFAPLVFIDKKGKPDGLFIDVLEHVAREKDWRIKYVSGTWEQCLERVETGKIDLITCIGYSTERAASLDFTKHFLFLDWGRLYEKIGSGSESIFDLEGKKVAVLKGSIYTSGFKSLLNRFEVRADLVEKDNYGQVFRAIEDGEVEAGINGRVAGILLGSEYKIKPTEILFSPVKIGFATPKGQGNYILRTLDAAIARLKADKSSIYYQRLKYWTEFYTRRSHVSPRLFWGLFGAATVCILSLGFVYLLKRQVGIRTSQLTRSNEALQESEAKFRMLVERMPVITYTAGLDTQSSTTYISPRVESLLGFTPDEYLADPDLWQRSLHHDDADRVLAALAKSHTTGEPFVSEYRMLAKDGRVRWFHDEGGVVDDEQGRPLHFLGVMADITESKRAEKELERSEALLSEAERVAKIGNWEWNARTNEVYWSAEMYRIFGVTPEQFKPDHETYLKFIPDEEREIHERKIEESLVRKGRFEDEYRLVTQEGLVKTVWVHGYVKLDEEGKAIGLRGTTQDISERRRVQDQLEESEARVRMKLDSIVSPDGDIGNLELGDVINAREIQELMDDFYEITRIGMGIIDLTGKILVGTGWQDICVKFHRRHPESLRNCIESDTQIASHLKEGELKLYRCLNNMWDIATPIMVGGNHLGNLFLGQFLFDDEEPDYEIFRARAREYGFDEKEYLEALDRVPRWSRETVDRVMRFYAKMTRILSRLSFSNIELARSIAERERLLDSLRESEQRYRLLADNTLDVIWQMDLDFRFTYVNPAIFSMTGYTPEEWIGTRLSDHCDEENFMKMARVALDEAKKGVDSSGVIIEAEMLKKSKERFSVEVHGKIILGEDGVPIALQGVTRDVTDRKRVERALQISHHRLDQIIEFLPNATIVIDSEGRVEAWNRATSDLTGIAAEDIIGKGNYEYALPFYGERRPCLMDLALTWDENYVEKYMSVKRLVDGVLVAESYHPDLKGGIYLSGIARVLYDGEGQPVGAIESLQDITEVKLTEKALRESERRWAQVIEFLPDATMVIDVKGTVIGWNQAMEDLTGVETTEILGKGDYEYALPFYGARRPVMIDLVMDYNPQVASQYHYVRQEGDCLVSETRLPDFRGRGVTWLWNVAAPLYNERGEVVGAIEAIRDITDRKKAEEALRASEERYRTVVEESFDGVFIQKGTVITFANSRLHEMLGYERGELEGMDHWIIYHPDYRDITRSRALARLRGEAVPSRYEVVLLRKDGGSIPGEINAKVVRFDNTPRIQVWIRDLTEEKLLEKRLVEAQKMEAIGTLAGGIAHDFNNLLHIIAGHAELLEMELVDRDMRFEEISAIRQAAHRGADLVKQILTFSRRVDRKLKSINLNEDVRDTERLLYRTIPKMIDIELHLEDGLKPIHADSTQIEQMLINLAVNAKDAMPEGGKLSIETRNVLLDEGYCRKHGELNPGPYVLLKVSDTGHGMEEEVLQHIFEPFFTTKGLADGTGLGLATVFGIVKMHGGHIVCESEVGKGTSFSVFFPVAEAAVSQAGQGEQSAPIAGGSETILVVDDESMIRDLAKRILEKSGYSVLTASSGVEALEIYAEERSRVSLVILDLIMPEMGGKQCLERLLEIDPQVKVLVASGFAVAGDTKSFLDAEAEGLVSKPFNMRELLRSVRHVLDGV